MEKSLEAWEIELREKARLEGSITSWEAIKLFKEIDRLRELVVRHRELYRAKLR